MVDLAAHELALSDFTLPQLQQLTHRTGELSSLPVLLRGYHRHQAAGLAAGLSAFGLSLARSRCASRYEELEVTGMQRFRDRMLAPSVNHWRSVVAFHSLGYAAQCRCLNWYSDGHLLQAFSLWLDLREAKTSQRKTAARSMWHWQENQAGAVWRQWRVARAVALRWAASTLTGEEYRERRILLRIEAMLCHWRHVTWQFQVGRRLNPFVSLCSECLWYMSGSGSG